MDARGKNLRGSEFVGQDLRGANFEGCDLYGVLFWSCDMRDVSFKGATLRNVSFTLPFSVTNSSYRAMQTVRFDGARMDKLTYASLKGLDADLSKVIVI
jgi:uncharacterized protein YjbI with pentapeptide repeats